MSETYMWQVHTELAPRQCFWLAHPPTGKGMFLTTLPGLACEVDVETARAAILCLRHQVGAIRAEAVDVSEGARFVPLSVRESLAF